MTPPAPVTALLPNGDTIYVVSPYGSTEVHGVTVLVVISFLSLFAVVGLLGVIALSAFNTRTSLDKHLFVRTHVAAYFISLLFCDLAQALGSIINIHWVQQMGVELGTICTAQGVLKQMSDVGTAIWTLVIAIHTFLLLVLEIKVGRVVLWTTLIGGWALVGTLVIAGPAGQDTVKRGPFFAIAGYWCWISPTFPGARITLDYMIMFLSALFSAILYTLMYLRVRGNLKITGRRMVLKFKDTSKFDTGISGDQAVKIARQMLLYPIAYTILILPIAASRFSAWSGADVPTEVTIFSAAVFLCSGIVNVVLFATTRNVLPRDSLSIRVSKASISKPRVIEVPSHVEAGNHDSYYGETKMVDVDLNEKDLEKASFHTRGGSKSTVRTDISQDIIPPMQHSDNRMTYNVDRPYGGFDVPEDVRESMQSSFSGPSREPFQFPRPEPALPQPNLARNDSKRSEVDSMYDFYADERRSTIASYYQYNAGEQEHADLPEDLQRRALEYKRNQDPPV